MHTDIQIGGVYSVARTGDTYGVVKVVAHQPEIDIIYARVFGARFTARTQADQLSDENRDPEKMVRDLTVAVGILPVTARVFHFWQPELLFLQAVTEGEQSDLNDCFGEAKPWDDLIHA